MWISQIICAKHLSFNEDVFAEADSRKDIPQAEASSMQRTSEAEVAGIPEVTLRTMFWAGGGVTLEHGRTSRNSSVLLRGLFRSVLWAARRAWSGFKLETDDQICILQDGKCCKG